MASDDAAPPGAGANPPSAASGEGRAGPPGRTRRRADEWESDARHAAGGRPVDVAPETGPMSLDAPEAGFEDPDGDAT